MIASTNSWIVNLDNLSRIRPWLSDCLCRLATGGGFATRELYTDQDEVLFDTQRPIVINGIEELATRGDLLDRSIIIYLSAILESQRRPEKDFWSAFEKVRPYILGALLTAVSGALGNIQHVKLERLPRMADFGQWGVAAEDALGLQPGQFMQAYLGNRESANVLTLDSSLVAQTLLQLEDGTSWENTANNLLAEMNGLVGEAARSDKDWPKDGRAFRNVLHRLAPNLRAVGVEVEFLKRRQPKTGGRLLRIRKIEIRKDGIFVVTPVTLVTPVSEMGDNKPPGVTTALSPHESIVTPIRAQGDEGDRGDKEIHPQSNSPRHSHFLYEDEL
jgi:hypothetical protein